MFIDAINLEYSKLQKKDSDFNSIPQQPTASWSHIQAIVTVLVIEGKRKDPLKVLSSEKCLTSNSISFKPIL